MKCFLCVVVVLPQNQLECIACMFDAFFGFIQIRTEAITYCATVQVIHIGQMFLYALREKKTERNSNEFGFCLLNFTFVQHSFGLRRILDQTIAINLLHSLPALSTLSSVSRRPSCSNARAPWLQPNLVGAIDYRAKCVEHHERQNHCLRINSRMASSNYCMQKFCSISTTTCCIVPASACRTAQIFTHFNVCLIVAKRRISIYQNRINHIVCE